MPVRILYVNGDIMHRGGIESYMMNYYRHIDKTRIQIDFIVHGYDKGVYDEEIEMLGGKIYHVPVKSKDYFGNIKALKHIFSSGKYKIVHSHMDAMSMVVLRIAKKCGVPIRIAHSHNTQHLTNNKIKYIINQYARKNINKYATHLFACSEDAGKWLFGINAFNSQYVKIINNAIKVREYCFNQQKRDELRKLIGIEDNFVFGHIGRFDRQKNHFFLLQIFKEVLKFIPNAKLLLIGDGHLKDDIIVHINKFGISDNVIMMGVRSDVCDLINTFDLFLFPSLFEGLPMVLIEAQANGLRCIASDNIPKSVNITSLVSFISLSQTASEWASFIYKKIYNPIAKRLDTYQILYDSGYDIDFEAIKLQNLYMKMMEKYATDENFISK